MKLFTLIHGLWSGLLLIVLAGCSRQIITTASLLEEMADRKHLTYYPEQEFRLKQASSYNRLSVTEGNDDWFANNDMSHFIRIDTIGGRREFVMVDAEGPGAIVRWWMTFYKAQKGYIRVYIDHDTVPVIAGMPAEILSGEAVTRYPFSASLQKGAPIGEAGRDYDHNFYLPVPFAVHCKITYECDSLVMLYDYEGKPVPEGYYWPDVFYNICYRQYPQGTAVESFSRRSMDEAAIIAGSTGSLLGKAPDGSGEQEDLFADLAPGDTFSVQINRSAQAIEKMIMSLKANDTPQALCSTFISISFDGINTVWAPAGEFFGTGNAVRTHSTWMNRSDTHGNLESYWIMPFRQSCTLKVINHGNQPITLTGKLILNDYDWRPNSMYFAAHWHEYRDIRTRDENGSAFDLNFIDINGKGLYSGDQITLFNPTYEWWGEGDEKFFIDGESFPSIFGTGTEDYYGYSFGRPDTFSHPFLSQPTGAGNSGSGTTVNMRHRSLDAIPFTESLKAQMELWHWADVKMNYAVLTYLYIMPSFKINTK